MKKIVFVLSLIPFMSVSLYGMEEEKKKLRTSTNEEVKDLLNKLPAVDMPRESITKLVSTLIGKNKNSKSKSPKISKKEELELFRKSCMNIKKSELPN